jgi:hypothetical protein
MQDREFTLGEQVHHANKYLRNILKPSIIAAIVGLVIITIVGTFSYLGSATINEYTYTAYRINSANGPLCDPLNFIPVTDNDPAKVIVLDGQNADKSGVLTVDIVTRINGVQITNSKQFNNFLNNMTELKAGDSINMDILRSGKQASLTVQIAQPSKNAKIISLGIIIPSKCSPYYELKDEKVGYGPELIAVVSDNLDNIRYIAGIFTAIFGFFLLMTLWKGRKLSNEIDDWEKTYLEQQYVLTFETTTPTGSTKGEKVFNMAQIVFPELRQKDGKAALWQGNITGKENYNFDCFQITNESPSKLFVVKYFDKNEKVDSKNLQELVQVVLESKKSSPINDKISNLDRMKIFRIVCVAQEYDKDLLDDLKREEIMKNISEYPVDLILEKDESYSVLWVSNI